MKILEDNNSKVLKENYQRMMNSKVNSRSVKEQVIQEEGRKILELKITSNQDKEILKNAMEQMHIEKLKEDKRRDNKIKIATETIETNKKQQKYQKVLLKKEKEEEKRIEEWNKQREQKQIVFEEKILNKRKEAQVVRQKMIDKQVE